MRSVALLALTAFFALATLARADDFHDQNFVIGARAAGMGGAYTAIADDATASYVNPAGLTKITETALTVSANLYGYVSGAHDDVFGPGTAFTYEDMNVVPTTFGAARRISGDLVAGFSVMATDFLSYRANNLYPGYLSGAPYRDVALERMHTSHTLEANFGAAYSLTPRLSLGGSLTLFYDYFSMFVDLAYTDESLAPAAYFRQTESIEGDIYSVAAKLSFLFQATPSLSIGATLRSPSSTLFGSGYYYARQSGGTTEINEDFELVMYHPAKLMVGAAWTPFDGVTFAADLSYLGPGTYQIAPPYPTRVVREPVVNLNVGIEFPLFLHWTGQAGFFTNNSSAGDFDPDQGRWSSVDEVGYTFSLGWKRDHVTLYAGMIYISGEGESAGMDASLRDAPTPARTERIYLLLGSSTHF